MESQHKPWPPVPAQGGAKITGTPVSDMATQGVTTGTATCVPAQASAPQAVPSCLGDCAPIHPRMEITDSRQGERDLPAASGGGVSQPFVESSIEGGRSDVATSEEEALLAHEEGVQAEASGGAAHEEGAEAGTSGGGNKRKAGRTPPQGGKKKNKKKAKRTYDPEATDPFERAQADNLLAVILFRDHPYRALTHGDQEQVKAELMTLLSETAGGDLVPTFEGTRNRHGRLNVACSTRESYDWLCNAVNQITIHGDNTDGLALRCIPFGSEPKLVRAEVYLSGTPVTRDRFLRILGGQNRNLFTDRWVLKHQANTPKGQLLVWGIDLDSVAALEAVNMQPHFGLGRVTFRVSRDQTQAEES